MKITFAKILEISGLLLDLEQRIEGLNLTKFGYASKRLREKSISPVFGEYNFELESIRIDNALVDPATKAILTVPFDVKNPGGRLYKYDKEGLKRLMKAERDLRDEFDVKEFEITPFISSYIPNEITPDEYEMLEGIVLPEKKKPLKNNPKE